MLFAPYFRVSHKDKQRGISIEVQRETVEHWAAQLGHTLTAPYIDDGKSAYTDNLAKRPAFQQLLADAREKRFQGIVVYKYDRFARKTAVYFQVIDDLEQRGVLVRSATESEEWLSVGIHGLMAEQYSRMLSARMKDVRRWEASQGRHVGPVPIGYTRVRGILQPNEYAAAYRFAVEMRVTGKHSVIKITKALNTAGYTTQDGKPFKITQVEEMLKNPVYAGFVTYKGHRYQGGHEALIDQATWQRLEDVQQQRSKRRARPTIHHDPLLAGIGVCASCGAPLWHQPYRSGLRYYRCATTVHLGPGPIEGLVCIGLKNEAEATEQAFLSWLFGLSLTPHLLDEALRLLRQTHTPPRVNKADIDRRLKQLARAYGDGGYTEQEYNAKRSAYLAKLEELPATPLADPNAVIALLNDLPTLFVEATPNEKQALIRELVSEVYIARRKVLAIRPTKAAEALFLAAEQNLGWCQVDTSGFNLRSQGGPGGDVTRVRTTIKPILQRPALLLAS